MRAVSEVGSLAGRLVRALFVTSFFSCRVAVAAWPSFFYDHDTGTDIDIDQGRQLDAVSFVPGVRVS